MMKNNNLKGWVAKDFIIALLIFSAGIAIYVAMTASLASEYDNTNLIDQNFNSTFNKFSNMTDKADSMFSALTSGDGLKPYDAVELIFTGTFVVINLVFSSISIASAQILSFGSYFGIPTEISSILGILIVTIITISLVFIAINSVRGGKEL